MNIHIREFLFNGLNKLEESKNKKPINDLLFEGYTPIELEKHSMSFQRGNLLVGENGKLLIFESKIFNEQVPILLEYELDELLPNETISGQLLNESYYPNVFSKTTYAGGGSLTNNHGIDFQFSCPMYEGIFLLEEKTGMSKNVKIKRIS